MFYSGGKLCHLSIYLADYIIFRWLLIGLYRLKSENMNNVLFHVAGVEVPGVGVAGLV